MNKKLFFALTVLLLFYGFLTAQTEQWGGIGSYYDFAFSSTTTQRELSHGVGLQGRFFSFKKDIKVGFYAGFSVDYTIKNTITPLIGATPIDEKIPAKISFLLAPAFKFSLSDVAIFYVAPGIHTSLMPEFAFGVGADTGFLFFTNNSFFLCAGVTVAFHFVGVDFFRGGNLKQYFSTTIQPCFSIVWRGFK